MKKINKFWNMINHFKFFKLTISPNQNSKIINFKKTNKKMYLKQIPNKIFKIPQKIKGILEIFSNNSKIR